MARIGIMGGTFDPIHNGHLMLGRQALAEYVLSEVWYMPSGVPPHKRDHSVTAAADRLAMVRLAVDGIPGFVCSEFELKRPGVTYSSDTLKLLQEEYPAHQFYFIIGADSFFEIERWHHPREVMERAFLLVAGREYEGSHPAMEAQAEFLRKTYGARIGFLHCPQLPVSSSDIRDRLKGGGDVSGLVPAAVLRYLSAHGLYRPAAPAKA